MWVWDVKNRTASCELVLTQLCIAYSFIRRSLCGPGFSLAVHTVLYWHVGQYECALGRVGLRNRIAMNELVLTQLC